MESMLITWRQPPGNSNLLDLVPGWQLIISIKPPTTSGVFPRENLISCTQDLPSRELTYPTWGKGKSSSNMPYQGDMLIPWRVNNSDLASFSKNENHNKKQKHHRGGEFSVTKVQWACHTLLLGRAICTVPKKLQMRMTLWYPAGKAEIYLLHIQSCQWGCHMTLIPDSSINILNYAIDYRYP